MITRFDHCVIGARDLDTAIAAFQHLGFEVHPGGRHTGVGTHNALIRFGLDYLELIAICDPAEASRSSTGTGIAEVLRDRPGGFLGFALASDNLDEEYARAAGSEFGYHVSPPFGMERARPDGRVLKWRILVPGAHTWGRPWPFLIQWGTPDTDRLTWDGVGQHANGVTAIAGVTVAARDLDTVISLYRHQLGLAPDQMRIHLPDARSIDLLPNNTEGLVEVRLRVNDLSTSRDWLQRHGIRTQDESAHAFSVVPDEALGARLVFVA